MPDEKKTTTEAWLRVVFNAAVSAIFAVSLGMGLASGRLTVVRAFSISYESRPGAYVLAGLAIAAVTIGFAVAAWRGAARLMGR